jgi:hypothetical protein
MSHCIMSQKQRLRNLMTWRWITPLDALTLCDCLSFSQRLTEIKRDLVGTKWHLVDKWEVTKTGKRVKAFMTKRSKV